MNFSFGITTDGNNIDRVNTIIKSIDDLLIPNYEVIVIGGNIFANYIGINTKHILFDEQIKIGWITKKKNIITKNAIYDNIVYLHDYIVFHSDWYNGFLEYGDDFLVCMTKMLTIDNQRYRDWHVGWSPIAPGMEYLIPYDMVHLSKYMYISGAYWVAKKNIMLDFPLDENRVWGQSEDAEWSARFKQNNNFSINSKSTVQLLKYNDVVFSLASEETIKRLNEIKG